MAEQLAHAVQVHPGLQQVGGKAVTQQVYAATLGDTGGVARGVEVALAHAHVQRARGVSAGGEQPVRAARAASAAQPILPQLRQQPLIE